MLYRILFNSHFDGLFYNSDATINLASTSCTELKFTESRHSVPKLIDKDNILKKFIIFYK